MTNIAQNEPDRDPFGNPITTRQPLANRPKTRPAEPLDQDGKRLGRSPADDKLWHLALATCRYEVDLHRTEDFADVFDHRIVLDGLLDQTALHLHDDPLVVSDFTNLREQISDGPGLSDADDWMLSVLVHEVLGTPRHKAIWEAAKVFSGSKAEAEAFLRSKF